MESVKTFKENTFSGYKSKIISTSSKIKSTNSKIKSTNSNILNDILQEYCLKRHNFNPRKQSPNQFVKKLHLRMKYYYNNLYKVNSCNKK